MKVKTKPAPHVILNVALDHLVEPLSATEQHELQMMEDLRSRLLAMDLRVTTAALVPDRGEILERLGESVARRYFQLQGIPMPYPPTCYSEEAIQDIAKRFDLPQNNLARQPMVDVKALVQEEAVKMCVERRQIEVSERLGITVDEWTTHRQLFDRVREHRLMVRLQKAGVLRVGESATKALTLDRQPLLLKDAYGFTSAFALLLWWFTQAERRHPHQLFFMDSAKRFAFLNQENEPIAATVFSRLSSVSEPSAAVELFESLSFAR